MQGFPSRDAELSALADRVTEWMAEGVEADAIGVAARTDALAREAAAALRTRSIATCGLAENNGVRVGTMHSMKGLEFRCTAVIGADADHLPYEPHGPGRRGPRRPRARRPEGAQPRVRGLHAGPRLPVRLLHRRAEQVPSRTVAARPTATAPKANE